MKELIREITTFWEEKGLYDNSTALSQCLKLSEEIGEMDRCILDKDWEGLKYEIGDCCIVLINICNLFNTTFDYSLVDYTVLNKSKTDKIYISVEINKNFSKFYESVFYDMKKDFSFFLRLLILYIASQCCNLDTTLEECIRLAHNKNKNRKGKMIGANYVKDEDNEI